MRRGPAHLARFQAESLTLADCVVQVRGITAGKGWSEAWTARDRSHPLVLRDERFEQPVHVLRTRTQLVFSNHSDAKCSLHGYAMTAATSTGKLDTVFNFGMAEGQAGLVLAEAYLKRPGLYFVTDDIDTAKAAWLHVVDTPYGAGPTAVDGRFEVGELPPGTYSVEAWHAALSLDVQPRSEGGRPLYRRRPALVLTREITVEPGKDIDLDFTFPVD